MHPDITLHRLAAVLLSAVLCLLSCTKSEVQPQDSGERVLSDNISNSCITCIAEDKDGALWIGTERGLNRYSGSEYSQYFHTSSEQSILSNRITSLLVTSDGTLWVGTSTGVCSLNEDDSFKKYDIASTSKLVGEIFEKDGDIYITTLGNLLKLNREDDRFETVVRMSSTSTIQCCVIDQQSIDIFYSSSIVRYSLDGSEVIETLHLSGTLNDAFYDNDRFVYLASSAGLDIYDTRRNILEHSTREIRELETISGLDDERLLVSRGSDILIFNTIDRTFTPAPELGEGFNVSKTFADSKQNIWIGYSNNGVSVSYKYDRDFYAEDRVLKSSFLGKNVTSVTHDSEDRIWAVVDYRNLYLFEDDELKSVDMGRVFPDPLTKQQVMTNVFFDSSDNLYICVNFLIVKCSYLSGKLIPQSYYGIWGNTERPGNLNMTDVVVNATLIAEDTSHGIWIGSVDGNFRTIGDNSSIEAYPIQDNMLTHIGALTTLSNGMIAGGFYGRDIQIMDPKSKTITKTIPLSAEISRFFYLTALCEDKEGGLWVGTRAEGVYHISPDYSVIEHIQGTECNDICSIICDQKGDIWISTYDGLSQYHFDSKAITNYFKEDGLGGDQFNYNSSTILSDGKMIFGGSHGISVIENREGERLESVPFFFENLFVNNSLVLPYASDVLDKRLSLSPEVRLAPDDRQVTISFNGIDYEKRAHARYSYALDKNTEGSFTGVKNGVVSFSRFPYGRHTLYAKLTSLDNPSINETISLKIFAQRPWYISIFAKILYFMALMFLSISFFILSRRLYRSHIEHTLQMKTNEMNMTFFSNISHEFRTPLTMVSGAIKQLRSRTMDETESRRLYGIISRNSNRMLRLVNQILDIGKLEEDVLALNVRNHDATYLIKEIIDEFQFIANEKHATLKLRLGVDSIPMWIDEDKVEKILCNILSNAVKFTPSDNGIIAVDADMVSREEAGRYFTLSEKDIDNRYLFVSVFNSGSSIPESKLETVFERYAQLEEGARIGGTGIGLYYTRRLVELHHGYIRAYNKVSADDENRSGVVFTFILPVNDMSYSEQERLLTTSSERETSIIPFEEDMNASSGTSSEKATILVIDDDAEIVFFLKTMLSGEFNIVEFMDAEAGFKSIGQINPDLVLCDVLMPGIDGFELCRKVKSDLSICHIPFILLTAKHTIEDQIKGLNYGANAYITKPFDPDYLIAMLHSQLSNRDRLREVLTHSTESSNVEPTITDQLDKQFISSLYKLMEEGLSKPDMDVTEMAKALNVSRSQLYYKVKALTGETPHAFFNKYKLNVAAKWILEDKYKISAIAQDLGFVSASHFTTLFKKEFGCLPSDYKTLSEK